MIRRVQLQPHFLLGRVSRTVIDGRSSMKAVSLTLMLALLALTGCARIVWQKPGGTTQDFNRDTYVCTQQSRVGWTGAGLLGVSLAQANAQAESSNLYTMCMRANGWTPYRESDLAKASPPATTASQRRPSTPVPPTRLSAATIEAAAPSSAVKPGWVTMLTLNGVPRSIIFFTSKSGCEYEVSKNQRVAQPNGIRFEDCAAAAILANGPPNVWVTAGIGIDGLVGIGTEAHCEAIRRDMTAKNANPIPCKNLTMQLPEDLVPIQAVTIPTEERSEPVTRPVSDRPSWCGHTVETYMATWSGPPDNTCRTRKGVVISAPEPAKDPGPPPPPPTASGARDLQEYADGKKH
jgi:hypothetical protein